MVEYISFAVITLLAGLAQGVCGFGAGILMMMVLPLFFSISRSAAVAGIVSLVVTLLMIIRYRKQISIKKVIAPLLVYSASSALAIHDASRSAGRYFSSFAGSDTPISPLNDSDAIIVPSLSRTGTAMQLPFSEDSRSSKA